MTSDTRFHGAANTDPGVDGRSAVQIVASLWEKVEALVQLEIKLGLAEAEDKIAALKRELVAKAIGGATVFAGILALVGAVVAALALAIPLWLASALTGAVIIGAGSLLLRRPTAQLTPRTNEIQTRTPLNKETSHGTL